MCNMAKIARSLGFIPLLGTGLISQAGAQGFEVGGGIDPIYFETTKPKETAPSSMSRPSGEVLPPAIGARIEGIEMVAVTTRDLKDIAEMVVVILHWPAHSATVALSSVPGLAGVPADAAFSAMTSQALVVMKWSEEINARIEELLSRREATMVRFREGQSVPYYTVPAQGAAPGGGAGPGGGVGMVATPPPPGNKQEFKRERDNCPSA
jgi:hypothetical protein